MYDNYNERQLVTLGNFNYQSTRFEVWSGGKMIDTESLDTVVKLKTISNSNPSENSIEIEIISSSIMKHLPFKFSFDTAYSNGNRILLGIMAEKTNYDNYDSYSVFKSIAPFITRSEKKFDLNEPFACSLFTIQGQIAKITFTTAGTKSLVEFYPY